MKTHSKSSLFLLEIMLTLLIFLICAIVCVMIFAKASVTSMHSRDLNNASVLAQNAVEVIKSDKSAYSYVKFYDESLTETAEVNAVYQVKVTAGDKTGGVTFFAVDVAKASASEPLFSVSSAFYDTEAA